MLQKKVVVGRIGFIIILAIIVVMAIISVSKFTKLRDSAQVARAAREKNSSISSSVYFGPKATELIKEKHGEILRITKKLEKMNKEISLLNMRQKEINSQYDGIEWGNLPYKVRKEISHLKDKVADIEHERYTLVWRDYEVIYWGFVEKFKELGLLPPQSPDSVYTKGTK